MEKRLSRLFDYQRFEKSEKLGKLIQETECRCVNALSEDELSLVSAAGEFTMNPGTISGNGAIPGCGGADSGMEQILCEKGQFI